jgi:group I intron endonuclease
MLKQYDWTIYKIVNPKGRVYVGMTNNFRKRMGDYKNLNCGNQKLLFKSLNKYGFDNHEVSIIEQFKSTVSVCNGKEMFWIRTNMSNIYKFPEQNGLNLTDGGCGRVGCKHSEETKKKLSEHFKANPVKYTYRPPTKEETDKRKATIKAKWDLVGRKKDIPRVKKSRPKGVHYSPKTEFKKGMIPWSKGTKGVCGGHNKGIPVSDETRLKLRNAQLGKKHPNRKPMSKESIYKMTESKKKPIIMYDSKNNITKEYSSIKEAVEKDKISSSKIWSHLKGKVKRPASITFKYKEAS